MRKVIRIILAIVILISGTYAYVGYTQELQDNKVYQDVDKYIQSTEPIPNGDEVVIFPGVSDNTVDIVSKYQMDYKWDDLVAMNDDIVGWIYIPGNDVINFPVVQGRDNSFYLNHDYKGDWNADGAAFVDYRYNRLSLSKIIYGHNMNLSATKPIFTTIMSWKDKAYFDSHRTLYYTEKDGMTSEYLIVAVAHFNVLANEEYSYLDYFFETEEEFRGWLRYIEEHSFFYDLGDNTVDYRADEVIVLSTCDRRIGHNGSGRTILFCVNLTNNLIGG